MRGVTLFLTIITLPLFAAIGHDLYFNYQKDEVNFAQYKLTTVGYLWTHYDPEGFKTSKGIIDPENWTVLSGFILDQKTILVAGVFAAFFHLITLILWISKSGPFSGSIYKSKRLRNSKTDEILGNASKQKFKYKRR